MHGNKGKKFTEEHKRKLAESKFGENNPMWKGNDVKFSGIHRYIGRHKIKPKNCERCGKETEKLDCANISGLYTRNIDDYEWLCRKCHMEKDGRLDNRNKNGQFIKRGELNGS